MALTRLLATGSAGLRVRIEIEGIRLQVVSDPEMEFAEITEDDPAGFVRIYCLDWADIGGIVIDETVNLPEAKLEAQGSSLTLFETQDEQLSQTFFYRPSGEWFLVASVEASDTTLTLLETDGITDGDVLHIGTEAVYVDGVDSATELTVTRGYFGSIAQKHWANEGSIGYRKITNAPAKIRGRRARVYLYEDGNDPQGDGTQVWLGQVEADPSCDEAGTKWRVQLGSIFKRLDTKVGGDLDEPLTPRGILYTLGSPLAIALMEETDAGVRKVAGGAFMGFYETQREFCEALNTFLVTVAAAAVDISDSSSAPLVNTYRAVETADGRWTLQVHILSATLNSVAVALRSEVDGETDPSHFYDANHFLLPNYGVVDDETLDVVWSARGADDRTVPRGFFGFSEWTGFTNIIGQTVSTTTPPSNHAIYVDGIVSTDWDAPTFEFGSTSYDFDVLEANTTDNWIRLRNDAIAPLGSGARFFSARYAAGSLPRIHATRRLASGTLADLRDGLVADSIVYANRGAAPFITDTDLADWSVAAAAVAGRLPHLTSRTWSLGTTIDLNELLSHEFRLWGVFPVIESDGRIGIRELELPSATSARATVIDDEIVSIGWSSAARGNQAINKIDLKTGYDAREDDWAGPTIHTQDLDAFADDHVDRPLSIEPRSINTQEINVTPNELAEQAMPVLGIFGGPHVFIDVNVSWKLFNVLLGDAVLFSAEHLPSFTTGVRPIEDVIGLVVSRRWVLGEAHGRLRILASFANLAGYAPTARITDASDTGGDLWEITVNATMYAPLDNAGNVEANTDTFFAVGDLVRVVKYDSETSSQVTGTVTDVFTDVHVIVVQFDATWTPGGSLATNLWELMFQKSDVATASQLLFAYIRGTGNGGTPRSFAG